MSIIIVMAANVPDRHGYQLAQTLVAKNPQIYCRLDTLKLTWKSLQHYASTSTYRQFRADEMFDWLKRILLEDAPSSARPMQEEEPVCAPVEPGNVYSGTVSYVGTAFAKILSDDGFIAFLPLGEMSLNRISCASDAVSPGENLFFAILEPSKKVPGEWIASLTAVGEARKRMSLSLLDRGQKLTAEVAAFRENGTLLNAEGVELFVPLAELSWEAVSHPAYAVSLGQRVEAMVTRITIPDWNPKWRQSRCSAVASVRNCAPRPQPAFIPMAFSAVPFRLEAKSRRPVHLDTVLVHVLAELVSKHTVDDIHERTRLPLAALQAMLKVLTAEGLLNDGEPTPRASRLAEAETLAHEINASSFSALACNVAEQRTRIMDSEGRVPNPPYPEGYVIPDEYPPAWPQPVFCPRADEQFFRLSGSSIPDEVMSLLLDKKQQQLAAALQGDVRFHINLRASGARRPVCTYVPDHWIYGALWSAFDALGTRKPYRPEHGTPRATHLMLVQLDAYSDSAPAAERVFYEPYSTTFWQIRDAGLARLREQRSKSFPALPPLPAEGLPLPSGATAVRLQAAAWHSVYIRGQQ